MFFVNFNTGAGNYKSELGLDTLMSNVCEDLTYTQCSVSIEDEEGNTVADLPWYGVAPEDEDIITAQFGDSGFYGEWRIYE